ncbi:lytic transglycosylase domain-containing protein [Carboxydothermus pertinax]|uniref:Transglycosylase SLT domain-containing protein n=1 Tax=Carboxydothermus pertinax TaxID=870242 RepID=A0A1L8CXD3_9THEO|nr:lytic transglycosylase domain-containing protein [Carboxydothermus pertinax]GAV23563.1 hypothetical protein cpu_20730 [Carboxydothermus pertinax]
MTKKINGFTAFLIILIMGILLFPFWGKVLYPIKYRENIYDAATFAGVDPLLVAAVVKAESNFNPKAVSAKGALGLMQIMPKTAFWLAKEINEPFSRSEELFNPEKNLILGSYYLKYLIDRYDNLELALGAYNAGIANVDIWREKNIASNPNLYPFKETKAFVKKVLWNYKMYRFLY